MRFSFVLTLCSLLLGACCQQVLAQVSAPDNGGNINIVRVTATSITLNVGINGTGQGRVVAIAETPNSMPVPLAPVDGQFYQGSTVYGKGSSLGKGYAAYDGPNHSLTITGLKPDTYYYITSSDYNRDSSSIAYNTNNTSISLATRKNDPTPLPVTLVSFAGTVDAHSLATLQWATASEYNNAYFAVERSGDGLTFKELSKLPTAGASQGATYRYNDPQRLDVTTYYRLRQVDQDGTVQYSNVVALQPAPAIAQQVSVYPNPGNSQTINLSLQGYANKQLTIQLLDMLGKMVFSQTVTPLSDGFLAPLIPGADTTLAAGTYLLKIADATTTHQQRLTIAN